MADLLLRFPFRSPIGSCLRDRGWLSGPCVLVGMAQQWDIWRDLSTCCWTESQPALQVA